MATMSLAPITNHHFTYKQSSLGIRTYLERKERLIERHAPPAGVSVLCWTWWENVRSETLAQKWISRCRNWFAECEKNEAGVQR